MSVLKNRIRVHFTLTGTDFEPEAVTAATSLKPAKIWHVGDFIGVSSRRYDYHGWRIDSGLAETTGMAEQLEALLARLEPARRSLEPFIGTAYAEIGCVIYAYECVPEMHFSRDALQRVAEIGAEIDIDLYCLVEDGDEDASESAHEGSKSDR